MARRIAVICANHPLPNPGMVSADVAMEAFCRRHQLPGVREFYRLFTMEERNVEMAAARQERFRQLSRSPVEYRCLRTGFESARSADAIVYWGDFLHSREFLMQTAGVLAKIWAVATLQDGVRAILRTIYLRGEVQETIRKVCLFGGALLFNTARDYGDVEYASALEGILRGASRVWMRDVFSVADAERLGCSHAELGCDCALFLRPEDVDLFPCEKRQALPTRGTVGLFFGRNAGHTDIAADFGRAICQELGFRSEWLPWFDSTLIADRFTEARSFLPGLSEAPLAPEPTTGDLLRHLSGYVAVVTDTYHLCVNAWNFGVPAVCIGEAFPGVPFDVSAGWYGSWRDKRQVFYAMHGATELFTTVEELADLGRFAKRLHVVVESLRDAAFISSTVALVRQRAAKSEQMVLDALNTLIGRRDASGGGSLPC